MNTNPVSIKAVKYFKLKISMRKKNGVKSFSQIRVENHKEFDNITYLLIWRYNQYLVWA
jgi:hypothetical protein